MLIYVHIFSTFQALRSSSSSSSAFARCCPSAAEYLVVEYMGLRWSTKTLEAQRTALLDSAAQGSVGSVQGALLWWLAPSEEGQASEGLAKGFHSPDWGMVSDFDMGNEWTRELQSRILAEHVAILTTQRHASSTTGSDGTIDVRLEKSAALLGHWLAKARLLPLWVWLNAVNVRRVSVRTTDWNARNRGMHSWSVLCDLSSLGLCEWVWSEVQSVWACQFPRHWMHIHRKEIFMHNKGWSLPNREDKFRRGNKCQASRSCHFFMFFHPIFSSVSRSQHLCEPWGIARFCDSSDFISVISDSASLHIAAHRCHRSVLRRSAQLVYLGLGHLSSLWAWFLHTEWDSPNFLTSHPIQNNVEQHKEKLVENRVKCRCK